MKNDEELDYVLYIGNLPRDTPMADVRKLLEEHKIPFGQIDEKEGFAFAHIPSQEALDQACSELKDSELHGVVLKVEPARGNGIVKRREHARHSRVMQPNNALFVVNFDLHNDPETHLKEAFGKFGTLKMLQINKNYCFVHFETVDEAKRALTELHGSTIGGRQITVEYSDRTFPPTKRRYPASVNYHRPHPSQDHPRYDRYSPQRHRTAPYPSPPYDRRFPMPPPGYYDRLPVYRRSPSPIRHRLPPRMPMDGYGHGYDSREDDYGSRNIIRRDYHRRMY